MAGEFTTKYWVIVSVLALVLLVGTGALSVWICKIYDTEKTATLPPGVSPFPDVVPVVTPPTTDPTLNTCYQWCGGSECPNNVVDKCDTSSSNNTACVKATTCNTDLDCQNACSPPNSVTNPATCNTDKKTGLKVCGPPYQSCITGFPTPNADPSYLKKCVTDTDCNVCTDTPTGETMGCVFVQDASSLTLCDGQCTIEGIPGGTYCLPQRTGCDAKSGIATWTDQGWTCSCRWDNKVMSGPECNIMYACKNNMVTDGANGSNNDTRALQQLLVNCNDSSNPLCGQPWVPESGIDPTGYYDLNKGFGSVYDTNDPKAVKMPNCVCQCDGTDKLTNKGYTYDPNDHLTCVLDPCSSGAWGRSLIGDAAYQVNAVSGVIHSFKVVAPVAVQNQYLSIPNDDSALTLSTDPTSTKFEMMNWGTPDFNGVLKAYNNIGDNQYGPFTMLTVSADGASVGSQSFNAGTPNADRDSQKWVLQPISGYPQSPDNLDNLVMYNPTWNRPAGAQFTDPKYNDGKRYLIYNSSSNTFSLGSLDNPVVVLQRVVSLSTNNTSSATPTTYIPQPLTNCACSGANSVSSAPACFDSNDNFINFTTLMDANDLSKCDGTYSRNVSAVCDPYTIPNSVVTIKPTDESKMLCDLYAQDLKTLKSSTVIGTSTNLLPFRSGFVPGLNKFIDPITGVEELKSVCTLDPCTGKYGDAAYSLQSNSGFWDALNGQCTCTNGNTDDTTQNYYPFAVNDLNQKWNSRTCTPDNTSSVCVCNHITNPVCAVCQNACQGSNFCQSDPEFPCDAQNVSCDTDPVKGGPVCVCKGNCINRPGTGNLCMARIPKNGLCMGVEGKPEVCEDGYECKKLEKTYVKEERDSMGNSYDDCVATGDFISYCAQSSDRYCWDSLYPGNDPQAPAANNACTSSYDTCPVPTKA